MQIWQCDQDLLREESAEKRSETKGRATLPPCSSSSNSKCIVKDKKERNVLQMTSKNFEVLSFADNKRIVSDNI